MKARGIQLNVSDVSDDVLIKISDALYADKVASIKLLGRSYPIKMHHKGMKYVDIGGIRFIQQNRKKGTKYARMIAEGHEITWGMRSGQWIRIMDGEVRR